MCPIYEKATESGVGAAAGVIRISRRPRLLRIGRFCREIPLSSVLQPDIDENALRYGPCALPLPILRADTDRPGIM